MLHGASNSEFFLSCLHGFEPALAVNPSRAGSPGFRLTLPRFPPAVVHAICRGVSQVFHHEDTVLDLHSPVVVVGDIHGQILDLIRIFQQIGQPPTTHYLFLGDIVDRGDFSLECILLLFLLKITHPSEIFLIRGNHEFEILCQECGFQAELEAAYPNIPVWPSFSLAFSFLPLAAVIDRETVCVHGGIGPTLASVSQIKVLERPIHTIESAVLAGLLWSDPSEDEIEFSKSPRGVGWKFGKAPLHRFLRAGGFLRLIRGHECIEGGVEIAFDARCITVFSASNYCGRQGNEGGVFLIDPENGDAECVFPPLKWLPRAFAACAEFQMEETAVPAKGVRPGRRKTRCESSQEGVQSPQTVVVLWRPRRSGQESFG
jgi:protein phosphatase